MDFLYSERIYETRRGLFGFFFFSALFTWKRKPLLESTGRQGTEQQTLGRPAQTKTDDDGSGNGLGGRSYTGCDTTKYRRVLV